MTNFRYPKYPDPVFLKPDLRQMPDIRFQDKTGTIWIFDTISKKYKKYKNPTLVFLGHKLTYYEIRLYTEQSLQHYEYFIISSILSISCEICLGIRILDSVFNRVLEK